MISNWFYSEKKFLAEL